MTHKGVEPVTEDELGFKVKQEPAKNPGLLNEEPHVSGSIVSVRLRPIFQ